MTDITIERMNLSHIEGIAELEKVSFSTPWSAEGLKSELSREDNRFFAATENGNIIGYIGANNVLGEVYITNIAVFPDKRRQGIGELLLQRLIEESIGENADFVSLEVRKSNCAAICLYEKFGFVKVGARTSFYEKPREDALIYTKYLKGNNNENTRN